MSLLSLAEVKSRCWSGAGEPNWANHIAILPTPQFDEDELGNVGLDAHLGCWLATFRQDNISSLEIKSDTSEGKIARPFFVRLGQSFTLHPGQFILGSTFEWFRLPTNLAAHVIGKSSWGRRGLIIATATGVQPGFCGCLTLEIANVGQAPIEVRAGMPICQLFFEEVIGASEAVTSRFSGSRKPRIGSIKGDWLIQRVGKR
jgi:dCTP deaminase